MNKSELKAIFINAKATDAKYIGVSIQTEGSSQPEIIINPNANFDAKFDYYMEAYDDDLILIAAKGKGFRHQVQCLDRLGEYENHRHDKNDGMEK